jgi:hypothetical protein
MMLIAFSGYLDAACAGAVVSLALSPVASVGLAPPLPHAAKEIANKLIDVTFQDAANTFFIKRNPSIFLVYVYPLSLKRFQNIT